MTLTGTGADIVLVLTDPKRQPHQWVGMPEVLYKCIRREFDVAETGASNAAGREFLASVRALVSECSRLESPARAARVVAHSMLVMLDGSGESGGPLYRVLTEDGDSVKFFHHDL